jgi:glucosyl-3-phosphoglycerate synthase
MMGVDDTGPVPASAIRLFDHREFDIGALVDVKAAAGQTISVVLPARDEATTVGGIVERLRSALVDDAALVDDVLVVDDRSVDATAAVARDAGARVVRSVDVLPEVGMRAGKGEALWKGVAASTGSLVAFCDADLRDFDPRFVVGLVGPLLLHDDICFVKAFYDRPLDGSPRGGGRVTELMARPLVSALFPSLATIVQPLAGEFAGRRDVLESVPFVEGYGVDLGLLVDVARTCGVESIAQVDLGVRVHRNRPLSELGPMATAILLLALDRAGVPAPRDVILRTPERGEVGVSFGERPPLRQVLDRHAP